MIYNTSTIYNNTHLETTAEGTLVRNDDISTVSFRNYSDYAQMQEAIILPQVDITLVAQGNRIILSGKDYNFRYNPKTTKIPILPEIKQNIIEISGKNGGYDFGTEYGNRIITIDLWSAKNLTVEDIVKQKQFLRDFFVQNQIKRFTSERNNSQIYYNVKLYKNIEFVEYAGWFQTVISLIAVDAYGYEFTNASYEKDYSPNELEQNVHIENNNNTANGFTITLTGALYDVLIQIKDPEANVTGILPTTIQLSEGNKQIKAGEIILIDMNKMVAVKQEGNKKTNAVPLFDSNFDIFTKIPPNSSRDITITFNTEGINTGSVGVFYVGYGL